MLRSTFCHLPGIGLQRERQLWSVGVGSWDMLSEAEKLPRLASTRDRIKILLDESRKNLELSDPSYFARLLPVNQHWRLFPEFRHTTAYLDIETTGLGFESHITTIVVYDGSRLSHYVWGQNLADFEDDIRRYKLLVTYNGKCFDLPFIERDLKVKLRQAHIDLRYVLKSLGYMGGLKACEKRVGIGRNELEGVDGYFAVLLWDNYVSSNNDRALETLLAYNSLDVVNLETLMVIAYNMKVKRTPFAKTHLLSLPASPVLPFAPDIETIARIRRSTGL
ncbi:MAG: exonuclease [Ignavibacteriales bacterium CG07_land_8_20_14_0_80_59_12]|nr:MAG: exonuclease [Ignavibacteriales bacterium CG07_land_8_20_14_0_80_59_12]